MNRMITKELGLIVLGVLVGYHWRWHPLEVGALILGVSLVYL